MGCKMNMNISEEIPKPTNGGIYNGSRNILHELHFLTSSSLFISDFDLQFK